MLGERQSVTAEDLEKMVYLEQVVLACLCLHPVQLYAHLYLMSIGTRIILKWNCSRSYRECSS